MIEQGIQKKRHVIILAFQSLGIVYGDLSTSPLYVYKGAFSGFMQHHQTEDVVFGAFSFVFWSLTLFSLLKYVVLLLNADDNGEGGTLALYSLLCRHTKFSLLPNQQAADEDLSAYHRSGYSNINSTGSSFKRFLEKHKKTRTCLLLIVLFAACMVIGDGVFTPAISVLSSFQGLQTHEKSIHHGVLVAIVCAVLVGLFALQHCGTHRVSFLFAPIIIIWLVIIAVLGIYNIIKWNPRVYQALSPHYVYKFFEQTGKAGWVSIGGLLLCITGTEAMFVNLGHFSVASIRIAFSGVVYPCLVLQYMGQAAFLSQNFHVVSTSFYASIPAPCFWPVFTVAILAATVASQAVISATFSTVKQCQALGCFPRVKIVHTSRWIHGQIYIPEINWILMILSVIVIVGFQDTTLIGNAYGLTCMIVTFINSFLLSLVSIYVWHENILISLLPILFFWPVELVYLSSSFVKLSRGAWAPLVLSSAFMFITYVWHYGSKRKYLFDAQNKVSMKWILTLGPSLGIVRVPGIGLIYTELVHGIPSIFTHFVTNLPAIHQVVVFVCIKSVPIPHVSNRERYLVGRIGPKAYRMYRCIIRYGYKDLHKYEDDFEDNLAMSIAEFIRLEAEGCGSHDVSLEGRMAVVRRSEKFGTRLVTSGDGSNSSSSNHQRSSKSSSSSMWHTLQSLQSQNEEDVDLSHRMRTHYELAGEEDLEEEVREELEELVEAKDAGITYIVGHSYIKARRHSSFLKRFAIDVAYSFLRKNCRSPSVALHIPQISLIEVGMVYNV